MKHNRTCLIHDNIGEIYEECLGKENIKAKYYKNVSKVQALIHGKIPKNNLGENKLDTTINFREEIFEGKNYKRVVMYLQSNGCEWALKSGNGCTMCGHIAKQTRTSERISTEEHIYEFEAKFNKIDFKEYPLLNIYNNGSFLNDNEISNDVMKHILQRVNSNKDIKMLTIETRPEFVTEEKIKEIKELIPDKHVEVAMGLEIKDDSYRSIFLNKGFSLKQFEKAATIITKYLNLRTYVFLKPPFLTEEESIQNAVETIEYAFKVGSKTVSMEACTIQSYTLIEYLYKNELYKTPYLWSIIEVIKRVKANKKLIIGLFQFYPAPNKVPYNCNKCSEKVMDAIKIYNRTLDKNVFEGLDCSCKTEWEEILKEDHQDLAKKIESCISALKIIEEENNNNDEE